MIPVLVALLVLIAVPLGVTADEAAPAVEQVDMEAAKVTFEETCSKCHDLKRPLGKSKDQRGWERTVSRMSGYHKRFGGPIPPEDQDAIIQYLLVNAGK